MGQFSSNNSYFSLAMISLDNLLEIQKSNKISIYDQFGSGSVKSAGSVVRPNLAEPPSSAELPNQNRTFGRSLLKTLKQSLKITEKVSFIVNDRTVRYGSVVRPNQAVRRGSAEPPNQQFLPNHNRTYNKCQFWKMMRGYLEIRCYFWQIIETYC